MIKEIIFAVLINFVTADGCYWNEECPYLLYSSKTPYDTVRGDIRDYNDPENCEPISLWSLMRHGNRNPGSSVTSDIKAIALLKDEIIASYEAGRGELCAQDIEEFKRWTWNETLETSASYLTGVGYEELFDIAKRIREKYPVLLRGEASDYYFRPTNEQRTVTSAMAFVHGLTEGTQLNLTIDSSRETDDIIRPYEICQRYQEEVKGGAAVENALNEYAASDDYIAVIHDVQHRLGITTQLSADDIYTIYEICRFYRSWSETKQSPWCAAFTSDELMVLEYRDDVRHYYRNGYGSWVNGKLGAFPMKNLYESFDAAVQDEGLKITSYFTHDTMLEMVFCALGLFKDESLEGSVRNPDRAWKSSYIAPFSNNLIAILYSCRESGELTHRVQILHNERVSDLCPPEACTWEEFQQKFQPFTEETLEFCDPEYDYVPVYDSAGRLGSSCILLALLSVWAWRW